MKDSSNELKTAYYNTLQDNITLSEVTVDVFEIVAANQALPYIYMADFDAVEDSCKDGFGFNVTIGFSIVTKYPNAVGGAVESDSIVNQILTLVRAKTQLTGLTNFEIITTRLSSTFQTKRTDNTGTTVTRVIRLEHYIDQIGGDLPRITDLTAIKNSETIIDLAWSNIAGNTGYRIERSTDLESWALLTTVLTDVVVYSDIGLSLGTYHYRVRAFDDSGGSTWSNISTEKLASSAGSGWLYQDIPINNSLISYANFDDGYNQDEGLLSNTKNSDPLHIAKLDFNDANPFFNLDDDNQFGNTNRFTDEDGLQVYGNDYAIDHLYNRGWKITPAGAGLWANNLTAADSYTNLGFTDFRCANINEQFTLFNFGITNERETMLYPPFNTTLSSALMSTITTPQDNGSSISFNSIVQVFGFVTQGNLKSSFNSSAFYLRKHY